MQAKNNYGINVMHVAAQGDQPVSLYYFKQRGVDIRSRDNRGSTPMHWACYSKSEVALLYLLAWVRPQQLDDKDCDGYTPLHLAVKSVESLKSTRPVRALLIKGAPRDAVDNQERTPIDLAEFVITPDLRETLMADLREPNDLSCLMLKTPLKLVKRSFVTPVFMWTLMVFVYGNLMLIYFPCKSAEQ
jgi:Ankyrin repeats (3 copies)